MKYAFIILVLMAAVMLGCSTNRQDRTAVMDQPLTEFVVWDTRWIDSLKLTKPQIKETLLSHKQVDLVPQEVYSEAGNIARVREQDRSTKVWMVLGLSGLNPDRILGAKTWDNIDLLGDYVVGYQNASRSGEFFLEAHWGLKPSGRDEGRFLDGIGASLALLDSYYGHSDWTYQVIWYPSWVIAFDGQKTAGVFLGSLNYDGTLGSPEAEKVVPGQLYDGEDLNKALKSSYGFNGLR